MIQLEDLVIIPRDSCSVANRKKETHYPVVPPSGSCPWDLPPPLDGDIWPLPVGNIPMGLSHTD